MTFIAVQAELPGVHIVRPVATSTGRWHFGDIGTRVPVASAANYLGVRPIERKVRLDVVIEHRNGPLVARVAGTAVLAERAAMDVVIVVTIRTCGPRILELHRLVAATARRRRMHAGQRESREIMIECHRRMPFGLSMAIAAVLAELAPMAVVERMTAATGQWQRDIGTVFVTGRAVQLRMTAM